MIALSPEDVADYVAERARANPRVQQIVEEVRLFDGLQEHAGWRRLYQGIKEQRATFMLSIAKRLMSAEIVDQREIDYKRGYFDGARDVIQRPIEVAESLEAAARRAYLMTQLELLTDNEDESPYL